MLWQREGPLHEGKGQTVLAALNSQLVIGTGGGLITTFIVFPDIVALHVAPYCPPTPKLQSHQSGVEQDFTFAPAGIGPGELEKVVGQGQELRVL